MSLLDFFFLVKNRNRLTPLHRSNFIRVTQQTLYPDGSPFCLFVYLLFLLLFSRAFLFLWSPLTFETSVLNVVRNSISLTSCVFWFLFWIFPRSPMFLGECVECVGPLFSIIKVTYKTIFFFCTFLLFTPDLKSHTTFFFCFVLFFESGWI